MARSIWANPLFQLTLVLLTWPVLPVYADDLAKLDSAIKHVPADAVFFHSHLRLGEQCEAVAKSETWKRFCKLPYVQQAQGQILENWNDPKSALGQLRGQLLRPDNQELLELVKDLLSNEVFAYGGPNFVDFKQLVRRLFWETGAYQVYVLGAPLSWHNEEDEYEPVKTGLRILDENLRGVCVPEMTFGFKLTQVDAARSQLLRLEKLLEEVAKDNPIFKERFTRKKIGRFEMLVFSFDTTMIPADVLEVDESLKKEFKNHKRLMQRWNTLKGQIGVGFGDGYAIVATGETLNHLERFGTGKRLVDRPELKPLHRLADKRFLNINFLAKELLKKPIAYEVVFKDVSTALLRLDKGKEIGLETRANLQNEWKQFFSENNKQLPEPGALFDVLFWTEHGSEGLAYDYGAHPNVDSLNPLDILRHAGESPILVSAGRGQWLAESANRLIRFLQMAQRCGDLLLDSESAIPEIPRLKRLSKELLPLMNQFNKTTASYLLPALADGRVAFVLDSKLLSKQWHASWPISETPIPLVEPALVFAVNDRSKLMTAAREYWQIGDQILGLLPAEFPDYCRGSAMPKAMPEKLKGGSAFSWPLTRAWGVDEQVVPTAGLSENYLALTLSHDHAERLLKPTRLNFDDARAQNGAKKIAEAFYFSPPRLFDALYPWIEFAMHWELNQKASKTKVDDFQEELKAAKEILWQVKETLELLKVFHEYCSFTYLEDGVWVTHSELHFKDA